MMIYYLIICIQSLACKNTRKDIGISIVSHIAFCAHLYGIEFNFQRIGKSKKNKITFFLLLYTYPFRYATVAFWLNLLVFFSPVVSFTLTRAQIPCKNCMHIGIYGIGTSAEADVFATSQLIKRPTNVVFEH